MTETATPPNEHLATPDNASNSPADTGDAPSVIESYARLVVLCDRYHQPRDRQSPSPPDELRQTIESIRRIVAHDPDPLLGLINLRLLSNRPAISAANTAIYAIILADQLQLDTTSIRRCAMAAIIEGPNDLRETTVDDSPALGTDAHWQFNLESVIELMDRGPVDTDAIAALVSNYERGFQSDQALPPTWYGSTRPLHPVCQLLELARDYNLLTQGFGDYEPLPPDVVAQILLTELGSHYNRDLAKLLINTVGIYPVGSLVRLSDDRRAMVIRSPETDDKDLFSVIRPTVRVIDDTEEVIVLNEDIHNDLYIASLDYHQSDDHPGATWFCSDRE